MNILVFTTAFHPSIGGVERQTLTLIYEFLKKGHSVKVISTQFHRFTMSSASHLKELDIYYQPGSLKKIQLFLWCDILYMPNLSLKGIWLLTINPFKKWVISHNDFSLHNNKGIKTKMKLFFLKFASHNISVSGSVAKYIKTNSTIIHNCYDNGIFKIYKEETREYDFVFLGRLVTQKGCDLLIRACQSLKVPFTLNIIGDGPEKHNLEKMVQNLALQENIKFLGTLEGGQLARVLNRHKVMIIPSIGEEGFGIVALEGMACGCKIIASDAGGLSEAVNCFGKTFKMKDQKELEKLLAEAINDSNYYNVNNIIGVDLDTYLTAHYKEAIAGKYLFLFKSA